MYRPQPEEFGVFYQKYIDTVSDDVVADLQSQASSFPEFLASIRPEKHSYAYANRKWTIKELVGHVIDTERIMTYRLTRFARMDETELVGFEENFYVANAHFNDRSMDSLIEEFRLLRSANMYLFTSLNDEELERKGLANGHVISVKALLFIIAGHLKHHRNIITDRYL